MLFRKLQRPLRENWNYVDWPPGLSPKGCLTYGGGSRYEEFGKGCLKLDNSGRMQEFKEGETYTNIIKLIHGSEIINNLSLVDINGFPLTENELNELTKNLDMLNVVLGLAMLSPGNRGDRWIDDDNYSPEANVQDKDFDVDIRNNEEPHPTNEGMFIFNVFLRKWNN